MNLFQIWYAERYYQTLHSFTSLIDLDHDSMLQECKNACARCMTKFSIEWMQFGTLWRLDDVKTVIFVLFRPYDI